MRDRGVNAIHVINRTNVWYQYRELPEALSAIRLVTKRYDKVFTYGSSMGGYAAIRRGCRRKNGDQDLAATFGCAESYCLRQALAFDRATH